MLTKTEELQEKLKNFGSALALLRKKKGLKQKELSDLCEISQRAQSAYERGDVAPKIDYLFKLQELGFNIQTLLSSYGTYELDAREQTIINLYRQANIETQMKVLEILADQAVKN